MSVSFPPPPETFSATVTVESAISLSGLVPHLNIPGVSESCGGFHDAIVGHNDVRLVLRDLDDVFAGGAVKCRIVQSLHDVDHRRGADDHIVVAIRISKSALAHVQHLRIDIRDEIIFTDRQAAGVDLLSDLSRFPRTQRIEGSPAYFAIGSDDQLAIG